MDHGTENGLIATTQIMFRTQHSDDLSGANSIRYGKSPANVVSAKKQHFNYFFSLYIAPQRIESWWSILRRHKTGWWIDTFKV